MGYYTDYYLNVRKIKDDFEYNALLNTMRENEIIEYVFYEGYYNEQNHSAEFECYDSVKWYDHDDKMISISEKYPDMYFELEGHGEEFGDFWRTYYHDGFKEDCPGELSFGKPKHIKWETQEK